MADLYARVEEQGQVAEDLFGTDLHGFTDGELPESFEAGSIINERIINGLVGETMTLIEEFGITPDEDDYGQVWTGVNRIASGEFGDGNDGALTLDDLQVMDRDLNAAALTITSTGVLETNGFKVFVQNSLVIDVGGIIRHNGTVGQAGASGGAGGAGGGGGSLSQGANGGDGETNAAGSAGSPSPFSLGGAGGNGGKNNGAAPDGGSGGARTLPVPEAGSYRTLDTARRGLVWGVNGGDWVQGGAGGGGGGGGAITSGGGGGGGGGVIIIWANALVNNGTIEAKGGDGGLGQLQSGGGGGGGGGTIYLVYRRKSGTGTVDVSGGSGGASETGAEGSAGADGADGTLIELYG